MHRKDENENETSIFSSKIPMHDIVDSRVFKICEHEIVLQEGT